MIGMMSTVIYPGSHTDKMDHVNVLDTHIMAVFLINTPSHNTCNKAHITVDCCLQIHYETRALMKIHYENIDVN